MVKSAPASSFKMTQSKFLFQLFIIAFNNPAVFGKVDEVSQRQVCGKSREPVFYWITFAFRSFDQKPFFRMRLRVPVIAMCRAHTNRSKALNKVKLVQTAKEDSEASGSADFEISGSPASPAATSSAETVMSRGL
jgi:hypothetical protein